LRRVAEAAVRDSEHAGTRDMAAEVLRLLDRVAATPPAEGLDLREVERDTERIRDPKAWWAGYSAGYIARGKEYAARAPEQPE